ncbi:Pam1p [Saccharomyces eubayanus]|uniref:Pam1p n=1 Tax=Saccharomyces eubayanus TaxID=1080349 RepID=UPI0006C4BB13|nr:PAM1-like protein [Saccharomyces eubayanus]KOH01082.1 PAM1-like protein [Saccharomyces eubayanus]
MTSALRVLVCGDHPNLILYTSRFQHAKNIEFYLVDNSVNASYEINSLFYGTERFQIQNHFQSLSDLIDLNRNGGLVFDLVIMSASSLQEIPQTLRNLKPMINNTTKILFESSGFVYLEPFIKASVDLPLSNIFSIFTDYDVRRLDKNSYKQFATSNSKSFSISIGQTTAIQESSYSKDIIPILNTFQKLFQKLFPKDIVTLYDCSPLTFLTKQWELAIPQICFDPLLIILEEKSPSNLDNNVLAKPLISGLLDETLSLIRKMGITFTNPHFQSEQTILKYWKEKYEGVSDIPTFLYYFIHKSSSLNIDLLLLQPILLADDFGIKTPYLECLFTMMSQYQLLNGGDSDWFIRKDGDTTLTHTNDFQNDIALKDGKIMQLQNLEITLRSQVKQLQNQVVSLKQEISLGKSSHEQELDILQKRMQSKTNELPDGNLSCANTNGITSPENMTNSDVSYEKSDHGNGSINDSRRQSFFNSTSDTTLSRDETSLKERELEVRKKELELQERELELQKRVLQQQQQYQQRPPKQAYNGPPGTPTANNNNNNINNNINNNNINNNINNNSKGYNPSRKSSYSQPQHMAMMSSRSLHGPNVSSPSPAFSANNFVDPIFPGTSYAGNNSRFSQQAPSQQYMHPVKPTSRKNRNSVMPNIGYVPGIANNEYGRKFNGNANAVNGTQSRLNSLSNQSTFRSQQGLPTPQQKPFSNNGSNNIRANRVSSANYNNLNQKPGFVNSVSSPNLNNFENNNNQQNFRSVDSAPCVNQLNNGSQHQLQPQPQLSSTNIPQINVTQPSPILNNFTTNNDPAPVAKFGIPSEATVTSTATSTNISAMTDENSKEEVKEKKKKKFSFFGKKKK